MVVGYTCIMKRAAEEEAEQVRIEQEENERLDRLRIDEEERKKKEQEERIKKEEEERIKKEEDRQEAIRREENNKVVNEYTPVLNENNSSKKAKLINVSKKEDKTTKQKKTSINPTMLALPAEVCRNPTKTKM